MCYTLRATCARVCRINHAYMISMFDMLQYYVFDGQPEKTQTCGSKFQTKPPNKSWHHVEDHGLRELTGGWALPGVLQVPGPPQTLGRRVGLESGENEEVIFLAGPEHSMYSVWCCLFSKISASIRTELMEVASCTYLARSYTLYAPEGVTSVDGFPLSSIGVLPVPYFAPRKICNTRNATSIMQYDSLLKHALPPGCDTRVCARSWYIRPVDKQRIEKINSGYGLEMTATQHLMVDVENATC